MNNLKTLNGLTVDDIQTSEMCYQSYPCQHVLTVKGVSHGLVMGTTIYELYKNNNLPIPDHFAEYLGYLQKGKLYQNIKKAVKENDLVKVKSFNFKRQDYSNELIDLAGDNLEMIKYLVEIGYTVESNQLEYAWNSPNRKDLMNYLVSIYKKNNTDYTKLLSHLSEKGLFDLVVELINNYEVTYKTNDHFKTPLYNAIWKKDDKYINYFFNLSLNNSIKYDRNELEIAAETKQFDLVKRLLELKLINTPNKYIRFILKKKVIYDSPEIYEYLNNYLKKN